MGLFDIFKINRVKSENELLSRNNNELKEKIKNLEQDIQKYHDRIVQKIDPTAEFNKTMLAEEFHQSIL